RASRAGGAGGHGLSSRSRSPGAPVQPVTTSAFRKRRHRAAPGHCPGAARLSFRIPIDLRRRGRAMPAHTPYSSRSSDRADVRGLRAALALRDLELDPLVFVQATEAARRDRRVVGEHVGATTVGGDKAVTLFRVEPLHRAESHVFSLPRLRDEAPCPPRVAVITLSRKTGNAISA